MLQLQGCSGAQGRLQSHDLVSSEHPTLVTTTTTTTKKHLTIQQSLHCSILHGLCCSMEDL